MIFNGRRRPSCHAIPHPTGQYVGRILEFLIQCNGWSKPAAPLVSEPFSSCGAGSYKPEIADWPFRRDGQRRFFFRLCGSPGKWNKMPALAVVFQCHLDSNRPHAPLNLRNLCAGLIKCVVFGKAIVFKFAIPFADTIRTFAPFLWHPNRKPYLIRE